MQVTVDVTGPWVQILKNVAERMGCDDYEEVFGRSLALADVITYCLGEEGASVEILSPRLGPSTLDPGVLYGRAGLPPGSVL